MKGQFRENIDRRNTGSVKWGLIQEVDNPAVWYETKEYFGGDNILPMWVADMDFACPPEVVERLQKRAGHPVYGYTLADNEYNDAVIRWMKRRYSWDINKEWIVTTPGIVPALHMCVQAFTEPGEKVLIQKPVYYPFFSAIEENNRTLISSSLLCESDRYTMDFDDFARKVADPLCTLAILCNPHNPVGRVWNREELIEFGRICKKNGVLVIADEIHGDLVYEKNSFTPFASLEDFSSFTFSCTAPSKTFNLAGLHTSNCIVANPDIRERFQKVLKRNGLLGLNPFGREACIAAYSHGEQWLNSLLGVLQENIDLVRTFLQKRLPQVHLIPTEGTYLVWLDCRGLGLDHMELRRKILAEAKIFLDDGFIFGKEGEGFQRMNVACPKSIVEEALCRMEKALKI